MLFDRPNTTDWTSGGTLTFSDGSTLSVSGIPNNGGARSIVFADKTVTWVKFQVSSGSGTNRGLSEMAVYRIPTGNLARSATITASSYYASNSNYAPSKVADGITKESDNGEWASNFELNPWIQLSWSSSQTIQQITFWDRPNTVDSVPGGTLTFSDGSTITVTGIPNDGSPYTVQFSSKTVTWVKFQVSGGSGSSNGLSEMEVY